MSRVPIRARLTVGFILLVGLVLGITGVFVYQRSSSDLRETLDLGLRSRAQDLAATLGEPRAQLASDRGPRLVDLGESFAQVTGSDGKILDASPTLRGQQLLTREELAQATSQTIVTERSQVAGLDEPARVLATPITRRGERLVLAVGTTLGDRADALASLRTQLLTGGLIALALLSLLGYLLAAAALRPIEAIRARAATISERRPDERLPVPLANDEVARLGETLNEMLSRLQGAVTRERRLLADAGHELRTPLALLKMELELALRPGATPLAIKEAAHSAAEETERLCQLADNLLLIAQDGRDTAGRKVPNVDAHATCRVVAGRFEAAFKRAGRALRAPTSESGGPLLCCDPLQLEQALTNMLDNALRHGGGVVEVSVREVARQVEFHVRDHGPGMPADFLEKAFDPFARSDNARSRAGAGLGLAIVETIAKTSGGTARLANHPQGGADVWDYLAP